MNDQHLDVEQEGPFGTPDGHRSAIDAPTFVELDPSIAQAGLLSRPTDRSARIIVGKKGSGKTVYLRRFQVSAVDEDSIFATRLDPTPPTTAQVVKFCQSYHGNDLTERWSQAWRVAILRSLCSYLLYSADLDAYGSTVQRRALKNAASDLLPEVGTPRSAHDQLGELIQSVDARASTRDLDEELSSGRWGDLEYWLGQIIQEAPPVFFYLDAVDEEYAAAPNYWLRCQKGLFYQVMRFLRDPVFGARLHIVISIRDNVFASVLRSEHSTRYRADPHIRILAWDRPAIGYLLNQKLKRLDLSQLMQASSEPTVGAWLGTTTIRNAHRNLDENLDDYLLRHTRLLPRDVILLGNALTADVERAKARNQKALTPEQIRQTVSDVASWCGDEQLAVCGNQIIGDQIPRGTASKGASFMASDEYRRTTTDTLGQIIRALGTDQFDSEILKGFIESGRDAFGGEIDIGTVLWQNGLLGFGDKRLTHDSWNFHGVEDVDRFHIPLDRERYALHPILLDTLGFNGAGGGSRPVKPWRRGAME